MMKGKDSSDNKGFAFVTFRSVDLATKAIGELNNTEFKVNVLTLLCLWELCSCLFKVCCFNCMC